MNDLNESVVVVTGGAKGIGFAVAMRLAEDGATSVVLLDVDESVLESASRELKECTRAEILTIKCDVSNESSVKSAFGIVNGLFGRVDILVNNAGITRDAIFHKMTTEQWLFVMNTHLNGMFFCSKEVVDGMRQRQYGRIVNMSSTSAFGNAGQANYATVKSGVIGFTKTLAIELASKGITVNAVAPGWVRTDMLKSVPGVEELIEKTPIKRAGEPEEVAALVSFLCSKDASYVSGEYIRCCGASFT